MKHITGLAKLWSLAVFGTTLFLMACCFGFRRLPSARVWISMVLHKQYVRHFRTCHLDSASSYTTQRCYDHCVVSHETWPLNNLLGIYLINYDTSLLPRFPVVCRPYVSHIGSRARIRLIQEWCCVFPFLNISAAWLPLIKSLLFTAGFCQYSSLNSES